MNLIACSVAGARRAFWLAMNLRASGRDVRRLTVNEHFDANPTGEHEPARLSFPRG
jgi:hypothetical protein